MTHRTLKLIWAAALVGLTAIILIRSHMASAQQTAAIHLDSSTTYQTITGWEAGAEIGQTDFPNEIALWQAETIDLAVNELGINRLRVGMRSGTENPVDYAGQFLDGTISREEDQQHWFEIINDNDDPHLINPDGYQFTGLDFKIDTVVLPLKEALEARGEALYISLNVVDFDRKQGNSNVAYQTQPEEYGELILATFQHLEARYGWTPDAVEVILEPDVANWGNGRNVGRALVAAGDRLKAAGYSPAFIAPSNTDMGGAVRTFDQMMAVPGVADYLTELAYHRYRGVSDENLRAIYERKVQYGIDTAMLEHIGSGYQDLHQDLKIAQVSAWQQFALAYPYQSDNGAQYLWIDWSDKANPVVAIGRRTKFLHQYFYYIRQGAVRFEATTSDERFDPLAFENKDGSVVVVVKADRQGEITVENLPPGTYGLTYTTKREYRAPLPDQTLAAGQSLTAAIPAEGVLTVYGIGQAEAAAEPTPMAATPTEPPATAAPVQADAPTPPPAATQQPSPTAEAVAAVATESATPAPTTAADSPQQPWPWAWLVAALVAVVAAGWWLVSRRS